MFTWHALWIAIALSAGCRVFATLFAGPLQRTAEQNAIDHQELHDRLREKERLWRIKRDHKLRQIWYWLTRSADQSVAVLPREVGNGLWREVHRDGRTSVERLVD
jgi:hypothetical protein